MEDNWEIIEPQVDDTAEFLEIAGDFGDPFEIFREAISNSFDAKATIMDIEINVKKINGYPQLIMIFKDNGLGMTYDQLKNNFWDLGNSYSRNIDENIGEKGHGTKIFLRSDKIRVLTSDGTKAYESTCDSPFNSLTENKLHKPKIREIIKDFKGTEIYIEGYNNNERSRYLFDIVKDYLYWFTKLGSYEKEFQKFEPVNFTVNLKCIDDLSFKKLPIGHIFAKENSNINNLFEKYEVNAADYYVKKFVKEGRLTQRPEVEYKAVVYLEGLQAKRDYNPLLKSKISKDKGYYKVNDRYGIWLSKDYIPVQRVNEWISNFGGGAGSIGLLHGFINCQDVKLTANRGSVANTDPGIIEELKKVLNEISEEIDEDIYKNNIVDLQKWQKQAKTMKLEKAEFDRRKQNILKRKSAQIMGATFLQPTNESELFGLFIALYYQEPLLFDFEPLDYNTTSGIDLIARNKSDQGVSDSQFWYVELKYILNDKFNHSFKNIRRIVCWDISKSLKDGSELTSIVEDERRILRISGEGDEKTYFLDTESSDIKIKIISLKKILWDKWKVRFN